MTSTYELALGAAVACAGVVFWTAGEQRRGVRRARLVLAGGGVVADEPWDVTRVLGPVRERWRAEWWAPVVGVVLGMLGASLLPVLAGAAAVPLVRRLRRAAEERREREGRVDAVIGLCAALAGEVRAGRQPGEALSLAARESAGVSAGSSAGVSAGLSAGVPAGSSAGLSAGLDEVRAGVLAAARFGGDVPAALAVAARQPGAEGLLGLAACWRVAVDQGAGLAAGLERVEEALRAERDQRADIRAQLAGPRATAVMLAGLPVLGLGLGAAIGADPLGVLLHSGAGLACLVVGGVLEAVGVWWVARIVRGAEVV